MASAIALYIGNVGIEGTSVKVDLNVLYYDTTLSIMEFHPVYVAFPPTATPNQIENAFEDAIMDGGKNYHPTMTLNRGDIVMLDIKRGTP